MKFTGAGWGQGCTGFRGQAEAGGERRGAEGVRGKAVRGGAGRAQADYVIVCVGAQRWVGLGLCVFEAITRTCVMLRTGRGAGVLTIGKRKA